MKLKPAQIIGGVSAATLLLANSLFAFNFITDYGVPPMDMWFWIWPISFVIALFSILAFIFLYKNNLVRYLAVGGFVVARLIYSLYWKKYNYLSIVETVKVFINWPEFRRFDLVGFAADIEFLSFIIFAVAIILSLVNLTQIQTPMVGAPGIVPPATNSYPRPAQTPKPQHRYAEIEVLGDLLAKGLLTQDEFDQKKREILGLDK